MTFPFLTSAESEAPNQMQFTMASESTPGRPNEDYAVIGTTWAAVLDGATAPEHINSGCIHDVPWLVRRLAGELSRILIANPDVPLDTGLADAIAATCEAHESTCDLTNPDSPSSTVTILRASDGRLDYLSLADSPLVLEINGEVEVLVDDSTAHLKDYSYAGVSAARNRPGGFYVASTLPEAAYHAVRGSIPAKQATRAALLTDGASRLADYFQLISWRDLLDVVDSNGPCHLIAQTRDAELRSTGPIDGRRRKAHDDATIVFVRL